MGEKSEFCVVNRGAIILRYRDPAIHWIKKVAPVDSTFESASDMWTQDLTVYLVSDEDVTGDIEVTRWIESNFAKLFEAELEGWFTDSSLWPQDRTLELFRHWFDVEVHSTIVDTVDGVLVSDEDD